MDPAHAAWPMTTNDPSPATWTAPTPRQRRRQRDVPGAMGGSRLLDQPRYEAEKQALLRFLALPGPLAVEVGFDHGINLLANARMFPRWRWLGAELRRKRVEALQPHVPDNCLAARLDGRTLFAALLPPASVARTDILFPTPTTKRKHLLFTEPFVADIDRATARGGVLHLRTDVADMAALLDELMAPWLDRWAPCPPPPRAPDLSRRERVCKRDGLPIYSRCWRRDGRKKELR